MNAAQILDQVEQMFIDHKLPHNMDAVRALAAPQIDQAARIAELETQLKEARELARCGGWTK